MAATPAFALYILGALAVIATIGLFIDYGDDATRVVVGFVAAIVWGLFGMSSFDVIVVESYAVTRTGSILPLAYLGLGFATVIGLYVLWALFSLVGEETGASQAEEVLR